MNLMVRVAMVVLLTQIDPTIAGTQSIDVRVGDESIHIPAPNGFHEISQLFPEIQKQAEQNTPSSNRLLATFVVETDLARLMNNESAELKRYLLLQTERSLEVEANMSEEEFQQLIALLKKEQDNWQGEIKEAIEELRHTEVVALGTFMENRNVVGIASLAKYKTPVNGKQIDRLVVCGTSVLRIKEKVLFAYVYSTYMAPADLEWVHTVSRAWADQILATNMILSSTGQSNRSELSPSRFNWARVFEKAIIGVMVGGLLGVIFAIFREVKKLFSRGQK